MITLTIATLFSITISSEYVKFIYKVIFMEMNSQKCCKIKRMKTKNNHNKTKQN